MALVTSLNPSEIEKDWPEETKEAAHWVTDKYGQPHEATPSLMIWYNVGPWKKLICYKEFHVHNFPIPHIDAVGSFIDYQVPLDKYDDVAQFDGSVVINRTTGEISARCHDEEANSLALNLVDDIVNGRKTVQEARDYYGYEFLAWRKKEPTPYMTGIRFKPQTTSADPDHRILSEDQIKKAVEEGKAKAQPEAS
jgi:hypothetical protein